MKDKPQLVQVMANNSKLMRNSSRLLQPFKGVRSAPELTVFCIGPAVGGSNCLGKGSWGMELGQPRVEEFNFVVASRQVGCVETNGVNEKVYA